MSARELCKETHRDQIETTHLQNETDPLPVNGLVGSCHLRQRKVFLVGASGALTESPASPVFGRPRSSSQVVAGDVANADYSIDKASRNQAELDLSGAVIGRRHQAVPSRHNALRACQPNRLCHAGTQARADARPQDRRA